MSERVTLTLNGQHHVGWTSVTITRSIEQIAGTFALQLSERWSQETVRRPVAAGSACALRLGDDLVIAGYVDDARPTINATTHTLQVAGRDATGDLVDCSAVHSPGEWKDQTLAQICTELCDPFGIPVSPLIDAGDKFTSFGLDEGESVFEAIERACRMRAVLPISDGHGGLILTRADTTASPVAELRTGEDGNVLSATGGASMRDRHSKIIVKGQAQGDDWTDPDDTASSAAEATDGNVGRYRPLIVIAEDQGDAASFQERAQWEANVRRARALSAEVTVQGWRRADGELWNPMDLVRVNVSELGMASTMLITSVTFELSEGGSLTKLSLAPPKAFDLIALKGDEDEEALW